MTIGPVQPADKARAAELGLRVSELPPGAQIHGPADLPLHAGQDRAVFRLWYLAAGADRYVAAVLGDVSGAEPALLRIESACTFGHVFGSRQCDCGWQWSTALGLIIRAGRGLLVYGVDQDARGLGLATHFDIYRMRQQESLDTEQVFKVLQAPWDSRDYAFLPPILRALGVRSAALLSNNASRLAMLREAGFTVRPQPLEADLTVDNMSTLMLEKEDLGYSWSFRTHADVLEQLQEHVAGRPDVTAAGLARAGEMPTAAGRAWADAVQPAVTALAGPVPAGERAVLYLTDLPRLDEMPGYAALGIQVIVVPYPVLPPLLRNAAAAGGMRLVDWARRNAWPALRPQWVPHSVSSTAHVYRRDACGTGPAVEPAFRMVQRASGQSAWNVGPPASEPPAAEGFVSAADAGALPLVAASWAGTGEPGR
jgi:GTP cyclohydrolase II